MYKSLGEAVRDAEAQHISLAQLALAQEAKDQGRTVEDIRGALQESNVMLTKFAFGPAIDFEYTKRRAVALQNTFIERRLR